MLVTIESPLLALFFIIHRKDVHRCTMLFDVCFVLFPILVNAFFLPVQGPPCMGMEILLNTVNITVGAKNLNHLFTNSDHRFFCLKKGTVCKIIRYFILRVNEIIA